MTDLFAQAVLPDPSSTSVTLVSALIAAIVALTGVIGWFGKTFLTGISQYRSDVLAYQSTLAKALGDANTSLDRARQEFIGELDKKRTEYLKEIKDERCIYLEELEKRDKVIDRLTGVVEKLVNEVNRLGMLFAQQFERGYPYARDQRNASN